MFRFIVFGLIFIHAIVLAEIPRACSTPDTDKYPFCDTKLSVDARIKDLISRLADSDKPPLLTARASPFSVPSIGLPEYDWGGNCVHGVQSRCGTRCPTSFPNPNALGASWNMSLVYGMGQVIGIEIRSLWLQGAGEDRPNNLPHIGLDCWSPNININRDPRWGRNVEVATEDPYIGGLYGSAYTRGLQEGKLDPRYLQAVVTLKHWAAYSLESYGNVTRHNFDAIVSAYDLANTYFPAFKTSVIDGKAKGVMCSYNALNGVPTCASQFLNNTLRGDWGFDGYVTSDSGAVYDIYGEHKYVKNGEEATAVALKAGTDINSGNVYESSMLKALSEGLIKESDIDLALYRTLKLRFELGLFDPIEDQPYWHVSPDAVNTPESQALNLLAGHQSLVLLKNEKKTLPFPKGKKVAVVGPHFNATNALLGNYLGQICPKEGDLSCMTSFLDGISKKNTGGSTTGAEGCTVSGKSTSGFAEAIAAAKDAEYVILALGLDGGVENEGHDRYSIALPGVQDQFSQEIIKLGKPTAVVLINGGAIGVDWLHDNAAAILEAFYPGFIGATTIADALFGDYNPGGKLAVTIYKSDYVNEVDFLDMSMTKAPGRSYKYFTGTPLWPFGWGLSYTTFTLELINTTKYHTISNVRGDAVTVRVNVTNVGDVEGDEVVQAYFKPDNDPKIIKQLFGFQRINLKPKQSQIVQFEMDYTTFKTADQKGNMMSVPGSYPIIITNGVDQTVNTFVKVEGKEIVIEPFTMFH